MAIPHALRQHELVHAGEGTGVWSWVTTVDHKRIGILYGVTAFAFLVIGGIEALIIRLQLARPHGAVVGAETFNALFTMHGTTMVFLAIMPLNAAFFNYMIPLMIGARDVAFPRLNALSYWILLLGGLFLNASFLVGAPPNGGWFGYANLTTRQFSPGPEIDFWMLSLQILGASSIMAAVNFIVTILNMRAPGMTLMRMPLFVWMSLVVQFLIVLAFPPITVGLIFLMFDRFFGTHFYDVAAGGDLHLWQHLFWIFGHPEVYILILPAFGIVSEVLPTFSRKPLFGGQVMIYSGVLIGFFGFGVWSHHMFAAGMGPVADAFFAISTMLIAIPTGVKIFNWLATMWGGTIRATVPFHYAAGLVALFTIGGLSGVMHASPPVDLQQTDTYFVVAHFHYVLIGGSLFGILAGASYWWPKMTGRLLDERLGRLGFWVLFAGFNLTFFPQHYLGAIGMPRRIYTYAAGTGWGFWNFWSTVGAFGIAFGVFLFAVNALLSLRRGPPAGADPWDGRTLEWRTSSPPPPHDFDEIPPVYSRDSFWREKYGDSRGRKPTPRPAAPDPHGIHMPAPSHWPIVIALGIVVAAVGALTSLALVLIGAAVLVGGSFAFALEHHRNPAHVRQEGGLGVDHRKLAMWVFLGSECFLFGTLIATYMAYKGRSVVGPHPHEILNLPITTLSTFDLLMSSLLMVLALAAVRRGDRFQSRLWLAGTAFFGLIFLGFQAYEFTSFVHEGLTLQTNLFGSTFFVLTGFHGGHVTLGVIWLLTLLGLDLRGRLGTPDAVKVEVAGLYWHFVDVVWIVIFTLVYLIP
ncbi:MAG: cytochrome c oxidase subunit I [Candidatus Rokuibacteriota bacterium]|nr:MAG: cytochrome c oxidase subunit I [Candidatus Rokubacteria bacterium]PYN21517.1 MAG: cytochrome c oxidase subunit I [Candidatus Rokubacteria bacterium]